MSRKLEFYPVVDKQNCHPYDLPPYFIEFNTWDGVKWTWQLFQRSYIFSRDEFDRLRAESTAVPSWAFPQAEGHPWNLGEGEVELREHAFSMDTRKFLEFLVDALNEKASKKPV